MMSTNETSYSRIEYERRFLVSPLSNWRNAIESYSKSFADKYLPNSRLRLRLMIDSDTGRRVRKLNKKFESTSPYYRESSRILLSVSEYELLDRIEGYRLKKTRYYHTHLGTVFSIDAFEGELQGLVLSETEAAGLDELMRIVPPDYAKYEVTEDDFFTGWNLCRITRAQLLSKLESFK